MSASPHRDAVPLPAVLLITALISLSTGVFWSGLSFIAKHTYDFDEARNLVLFAFMGSIYMTGAFTAGRLTRALVPWLSTRGVLAAATIIQAAVCAVPLVVEAEWALWLATGVVSLMSSIIWPIVESFLTAGRHGRDMRSAIASFNLTWMPATVVAMFAIAPLLEAHGEWAIGGLVITNLVALVPIMSLSREPGAHDLEASAANVPPSYPHLLRSSRVLLPISYLLMSVLSPLLPYRFEAIGVDVQWQTPATAMWMMTRVVTLLVMWRLHAWHGRWGTLLLAGALMAGGFAVAALAPTLPIMLGGLAMFGGGLGIIYYAALYYVMAVGQAEVDASGTHEGLIGAGYAFGPITGLLGVALGGGAVVVGVSLAVAGVGSTAAIAPYFRRRSVTRATRSGIAKPGQS